MKTVRQFTARAINQLCTQLIEACEDTLDSDANYVVTTINDKNLVLTGAAIYFGYNHYNTADEHPQVTRLLDNHLEVLAEALL